jgi:DNA-binding HxlR family transcriptional regulator
MRHQHYSLPGCSVEAALEAIGGKWKGGILFHLLDGTKRFSELRRLMPGITQRALTQQLRELESDGVVSRKVYAQVPPRVDYSLTALGQALKPIVKLLGQWGDRYQLEMQARSRKAERSRREASASQ